MKNRFNNLTSKQWLPFQKSWYIEESIEDTYEKNLGFFVKYDLEDNYPNNVFFFGSQQKLNTFEEQAKIKGAKIITTENLHKTDQLQFAIFDLTDLIASKTEYYKFKEQVLKLLTEIYDKLRHRRFVSIFIKNQIIKNEYYTFAWDISYSVAKLYTLKDEKIACYETKNNEDNKGLYLTKQNYYYSLYFRKDEKSLGDKNMAGEFGLFENIAQQKSKIYTPEKIDNWFILRPKRRTKKEVSHPAKYPEELVNIFIKYFTKEGDNIFDPMSGMGSTQVCANQNNRNGYGYELSDFFAQLANERLNVLENTNSNSKILNKDARDIDKNDFPRIDYIITSPPYWNMLNMKGAENQAKRIKKGLRVNYSDRTDDFGNIEDYQEFINDLVSLYFKTISILKPGGYFTLVVKNIKKKGWNYPFAYDLGRKLQKKLILTQEVFWLQNDINIAPYGYGNTFVSNTFHHYCLTFQKPFIK